MLFFFYWGKIEFCKIKAHDFADNFYQLPEKTLTIFSTGIGNFKLNEDHEIIADGNLYDIVKTEKINGNTVYYALSDEEEDVYTQKLSDWNKSNTDSKSMPSKTIELHIGKYFEVLKHIHPVLIPILNLYSYTKLPNDLFVYRSPLKIVFSPPPDLFFS